MIPLAIPSIGKAELDLVKGALGVGMVASGRHITLFEHEIATATGASHAIATSSGTAALHIALLVAGVQPGHKVIVPATTFVATANAVLYCGAEPVILDVEPDTWGLDPQKLADYLKTHTANAVLPVHLYGHPCQLDAIRGLACKNGLRVIEDAAEALGATYKGLPIGHEGLCVLSFNGNKLITTGGGGMILTDDADQAKRARHLISQAKEDGDELVYGAGFNYRMPNVNAAIGLAQMETIEERLASKRATAAYYQQTLPGVFREQSWARSSYWLSTMLVDDADMTQKRLAGQGIETRRVWRPLHQQPHLRGLEPFHVEVAEKLYRRGVCLPSSVGITDEERAKVVEALR